MTIRALLHASVIVSDLARARTFYEDVLGLVINPRRPDLGYDGAWYDIGSQQIHLLALPNPDPVDGRPAHGGRDRHIALAVDNITALKDRLDSHGVTYTLSRSGRAALFCRDPDGNALEFVEGSG